MSVCYCKMGAGGPPCVSRAVCDARGGTLQYVEQRKICYQCDTYTDYLFDDRRCIDCTRLTREEIEG